MITTYTGSPSGIGLPLSWSDPVPAGTAHTFPSQGGVSRVTADRRPAGKAPVCPFAVTTDALEGPSSGTSVWSPPI